MNIAAIINRLSVVRKFAVDVKSDGDCSAKGHGSVDVEHFSPAIVTWRESGRWDSGFDNMDFTNIYRWSTLQQEYLGLEHLRYGEENPVTLAKLRIGGSGQWLSSCPYLCLNDSYMLRLKVNENEVIMNWKITGPHKNQISTVCYR